MTKVTVAIIVGVFLAAVAFATQLCPACGAANPDENNFCEACGSPLKAMVTCPQCGEKYPEGTVACGKCGYVFLKPKIVMITVEPKEAEIYINGVERARGKEELILEPGKRARVEAKLEGYDDFCGTVNYESPQTTLTLTLTKVVTEKPGIVPQNPPELKETIFTGKGRFTVGVYGGIGYASYAEAEIGSPVYNWGVPFLPNTFGFYPNTHIECNITLTAKYGIETSVGYHWLRAHYKTSETDYLGLEPLVAPSSLLMPVTGAVKYTTSINSFEISAAIGGGVFVERVGVTGTTLNQGGPDIWAGAFWMYAPGLFVGGDLGYWWKNLTFGFKPRRIYGLELRTLLRVFKLHS